MIYPKYWDLKPFFSDEDKKNKCSMLGTWPTQATWNKWNFRQKLKAQKIFTNEKTAPIRAIIGK